MGDVGLKSEIRDADIAIIGLAGRFPQAANIEIFWRNLCAGVEGISVFSEQELRAMGIDPRLLERPDYVRARAVLDDIELFDAAFFGFSAREAELLDPQHRLFLETAWQAIEDAGYNVDTYDGAIGVYAGSGLSTYLLHNLVPNQQVVELYGSLQLRISNDKDFMATQTAYKLNLRGPSLAVQTACSTSLVATCLACQALLNYQCDMALAGGVEIEVPHRQGYLYQPGGILSPDGHCRAFDASAQGTVSGNGAGAVLLKRLSDAVADGDHIYAVIRGSAMNNDGAVKVNYTAPSIDGQAEVIAMAQAVAGVDPATIGYIEAHGTGTPLGDPIEIAALAQVFEGSAAEPESCAIGSVKTNIGHLDAAAGVAGLIKTALALKHEQIPPSLHFEQLNPQISFDHTPFYVNTRLQPWPAGAQPRRAGVSSFGVGGTNAHVVLEEAPEQAASAPAQPWQLLTLSARSTQALHSARANLAAYISQRPDANLADIAYTLQLGRKAFEHRQTIVCRDLADAHAVLSGAHDERILSDRAGDRQRTVTFMFSGTGEQYVNMAQELYHTETVFRATIDQCAELLADQLRLDIRDVLYPDTDGDALQATAERLKQTWLGQPVLFAIEYALAQLWRSWGVEPDALIGHSLGEYVAATLADVLSLEDALWLVTERARLIQGLPEGAMLAVRLPEHALIELLAPGLALAAVNGPNTAVVAGTLTAIDAFEERLRGQGIESRRVPTTHAFHSMMLDPILDQFAERVRRVQLQPPQIRYISNVTGTWIKPAEATSPQYWVRHLRQTVRFGQGVAELLRLPNQTLLEVGPGRSLQTFAQQQSQAQPGMVVLTSLRRSRDHSSDRAFILTTLGRLWLTGAAINWQALHEGAISEGQPAQRRRVPLPTYPFERQRYWIEPLPAATSSALYQEGTVAPAEPGIAAQTPPPGSLLSQHERPQLQTPYVAPRTPVEQRISAIWQELLGVEPIGIYDNFFELGGHSLLATQVLSRLRDTLQIELPLSTFFEAETVAVLAERVAELTVTSAESLTSPIPRAPREQDLPLSFAQQQLWFLQQLNPLSTTYNISFAARLRGRLDIDALRESFNVVVQRHEVLRTIFIERDGTPYQQILPPHDITITQVTLKSLPPDARAEELSHLLATEADRPFVLDRGPLLRVLLVQHSPDEHVIVLTMHHIIGDGWSLGVLVEELVTLYQQHDHARGQALPVLAIQYADYAIWQRAWLAPDGSGDLQRRLSYWRQQLADPPILALPTDRPRPPVPSFRGATARFDLPAALSAELRALAQQEGATLFMTLLTAWQILLGRYSGQDDIVIGTPIANRTRAELEPLVGFFVNTIVLRTSVAGNPSFRTALERTRQVALEAYTHQELPFELLVQELQPDRDLSRNPFFQVLFALQNTPMPQIKLPELTLTGEPINSATAKFDLWLALEESDETLHGGLEYSTDLFDAATIDRMITHFVTLLAGIVANPDQPVAMLPLVDDAERQQLISARSSTAFASYRDNAVGLQQLVEQQAGRTPDLVALIHDMTTISYQELNARANQLAVRLRQLGVGSAGSAEPCVGICLRRSVDLVIGVLGILKAGAAYVPLDPAYPRERLQFMIADAHLEVLVTEQAVLSLLPATLPPIVDLDSERAHLAALPDVNLPQHGTPDDLAYVIYTSGSTGRPKGVAITQRNALAFVSWAQQMFQPDQLAGVLAATSICFDLSIFELFVPLSTGGTVILAENALELPQLPSAARVTLINTVPSAAAELLRQEAIPASVRTVNLAGEALPLALVQQLYRQPTIEHVFNLYGPSETTTYSSWASLPRDLSSAPPIGQPIADTQIAIVDAWMQPVPVGVVGELYIGGAGVARGYLGRPALTAERFIPDPWSATPGGRLYRTGDLGRYRADGQIEYLGRADQQLKLRGFRIELGEIEAVLRQQPGVQAAIVVARVMAGGDQGLVAYVVAQEPKTKNQEPTGETPGSPFSVPGSASVSELRAALRERLPEYMVPSAIMVLDALPLTPNGKVDRQALPLPENLASAATVAYVAPQSEVEQTIAQVWQAVLGVARVGVHDNFFDLGGHSLLVARVHSQLRERFGHDLSMIDLFRYPTISSLAAHLRRRDGTADPLDASERSAGRRRAARAEDSAIAIIAMSGRFPGAPDVHTFWDNLRAGVEAVSFFSDEELLGAGIDPATLEHPDYVKARGVLPAIDQFDAGFFNINPREAETMDPQHRIFLECAWSALESAGYDATRYADRIGVFASVGPNTYLLHAGSALLAGAGQYQTLIGNDKDFVASRVSYKLGLRGPSVIVQTACSSSLVAVHVACQSLLSGESDMALAGGIAVTVPQIAGYLYESGGIPSPDGHCRAFDAQAQGTVMGSGAGVVVLKRLSDAQRDNDQIYAVIRGSAINNDGSDKIGYTAPSIHGQAQVIGDALANAQVAPETISYIEAHGTGTPLGDPIELAALSQVFRTSAQQPDSCAVGSAKTNIGHLDTAAGIAGLIKTTLALKHQQIPPSLNFSSPNPQIDWANSPFYVNTTLRDWPRNGTPRRAGVSSFGIGGTNVHMVLEEAPVRQPIPAAEQGWHVLPLSAKTATALDTATANLAAYLQQQPQVDLADVAYTLQLGRRPFSHRRMIVCREREAAIQMLTPPYGPELASAVAGENLPALAFLFPGQGAQYVNMGEQLYASEPLYRSTIDQCCALLLPQLGLDLRTVLYPPEAEHERATEQLTQTALAQPALFVTEYALAQLWQSWNVQPEALLGHSIGEYVAACLAGVLTLEDALTLVAARGRLMQSLPAGAMLAVPLAEEQVQPYLSEQVALAAINGSTQCVLSGTQAAIEQVQQQLDARGISSSRLRTSHAFHSAMVEPILAQFGAVLQTMTLRPPTIPLISNVTGTWLTPAQATSVEYWVAHLRQPVRFADGITTLFGRAESPAQSVLLEVGPGHSLSRFAMRHPLHQPERIVLTSFQRPQAGSCETVDLLTTLGRLWLAGVAVGWEQLHQQAHRQRVALPTYPFERQRYWVEPDTQSVRSETSTPSVRQSDPASWLYQPAWKRTPARQSRRTTQPRPAQSWLLLLDSCGIGAALAERLTHTAQTVVRVEPGPRFEQHSAGHYTIDPGDAAHYTLLFASLAEQQRLPEQIVHLWNVTPDQPRKGGIAGLRTAETAAFTSLLALVQSLDPHLSGQPCALWIVSNQLHEIIGRELVAPEKALLLGPCKVIPQEYRQIVCRSIDIVVDQHEQPAPALLDQLIDELGGTTTDTIIAYRETHRWTQVFEPTPLALPEHVTRIREQGVYLITDGLHEIGFALAEALAQQAPIKLLLVEATPMPSADQWDAWLVDHPASDPISQRIERARRLEALGAVVEVVSADIANIEQVQALLAQQPTIHGVIHAAKAPAEHSIQLIQDMTPRASQEHFRVRAHGALVLAHVLSDRPLDFYVVVSSLTAVLGGVGTVAYTAANSFLDAFAQHGRPVQQPWLSIDWDRWHFGDEVAQLGLRSAELDRLALLPSEGSALFLRILEQIERGQVVVSTAPLSDRIAHWASARPATTPQEAAPQPTLHPRPHIGTAYVAPGSELEQRVAEIWQRALGIAQIGVHDNFFEIGGDSLVAIQVCTQLKQELAIDVPVARLYEGLTIQALAALGTASAQHDRSASDQDSTMVTGSVPLMRMALMFLNANHPNPNYWNIASLVEVHHQLDRTLLSEVVTALLVHHDALRLRFERGAAGWQQVIVAPGEPAPIHWIDLADRTEDAQRAALEVITSEEQRQLNVTTGPILRVTYIDYGRGRPGRLLFIIHHLVADALSLQIVLEDFQTAYEQRSRGAKIELPHKTTSFKAWCERLFAYAQTPGLLAHLDYWMGQPWQRLQLIPLDEPDGRTNNTIASQRNVSAQLSVEETAALFQHVLPAYDVQVRDVLLTAVTLAVAQWSASRLVAINTMGHGRDASEFPDVDLARTVGLLVTNIPMLLNLEAARTNEDALQTVKAYLRNIPMQGLSHSLLERITQDPAVNAQMQTIPRRDIFFNFLGRQQLDASDNAPFRQARELPGAIEDPQMLRNYLLSFTAIIVNNQLRLDLSYSVAAHRPATAERLAQTFVQILRELIRQAISAGQVPG